MKDTVIDPPLIGSGSQEEADKRVRDLLDLGTSRGFLTYEELNERLPDEVVSPDKLDSLLMMIDEMGIKLIAETDIAEFQKPSRKGDKGDKSADASDGKPEKTAAAAVKAIKATKSRPSRNAEEEIV